LVFGFWFLVFGFWLDRQCSTVLAREH